MNIQELQEDVDLLRTKGQSVGTLSDGYHTFNELYKHRCVLFIGLAKAQASRLTGPSVWMTKTHGDGTPIEEGWFLLGIGRSQGAQITYHLPISYWERCKEFAQERAKAFEFDGHSGEDVLNRILNL